jgi:FKBP-type peptidyl-prolyl cis-trans isomerase SlyD
MHALNVPRCAHHVCELPGVRAAQRCREQDFRMKIQKNAFVALDYTLTLDSGETVDKSEPGQPLGFVFGTGQMIPGLERQIEGMEAGQSAKVSVEPEEAYGPSRPDLYRQIPRANFPQDTDIEPGMIFEAHGPGGSIPMFVREVSDSSVTVDLNHPLAGQTLHFDLKIAEVREATADELAECEDGQCGDHECTHCGAH